MLNQITKSIIAPLVDSKGLSPYGHERVSTHTERVSQLFDAIVVVVVIDKLNVDHQRRCLCACTSKSKDAGGHQKDKTKAHESI